MDADRFDALARTLRSATTRRAALGGVVAGVLGLLGVPAAADRRPTRSDRRWSPAREAHQRHVPRQARAQTVPARCFRGTRCTPGPGANISQCNFGGSTALKRVNCRGCNASGSNLSGANASGADFSGANLGGACLVDADLTGVILKGAQLGGAIFCRTKMPNGSLDNSGCAKGTACCPTCRPATCQSLGKECGSWPDGCGGTLSCGRCPLGDTPVCDDGICARCDAACACGSCLTLADGSTICDEGTFGECTDPCSTAADCNKTPNLPACVVSLTERLTNETTTIASLCGPPVTVGACGALRPC